MKTSFQKTLSIAGIVMASALWADAASAGCYSHDAFSDAPKMQQQSWRGTGQLRMTLVDWQHHDDDIVGFWNIVVSSKGNPGIPDGTVLDRGLQQWHDDGTEMLNSSAQHPATQNYCLGTWVKTGAYTYKLNHFAYSYNADQSVAGLVRIRETVKVSRDGAAMTGTQTVDIYDNLRNHLTTIQGTLVGARIDQDTTAQDIR